MNKGRPVIGITSWYNYDTKMMYIKDGYCEAVGINYQTVYYEYKI